MSASTIALVVALVAAAINGLAAALGALRWWQVESSRAFWVLARAGQAASGVLAVAAGVLAVTGFDPIDGLFWLYALLPALVGFMAEQLRLGAAVQVLEHRGIPNARAVGGLPEAQQRSVVLAIVRRELGVMTLAAGVVALL
ncbi:MAG: hypothetical protein H0U79_01350, partial [Solirubrobacterales bacterium]|nr:hypothetical protein [Solirubrobacterales bacterium]